MSKLKTCLRRIECCAIVLVSTSTLWLSWDRSWLELESIVIDVEPIDADTLKLPAAAAATNWAPFSLRLSLAEELLADELVVDVLDVAFCLAAGVVEVAKGVVVNEAAAVVSLPFLGVTALEGAAVVWVLFLILSDFLLRNDSSCSS